MKTIAVKGVFRGIVQLRGYDPDTADLSAADKARVAELVNDRVEMAWNAAWWPEAMKVEERQYRATWDDTTTYGVGDEVYYDEVYYVSLQAANLDKQPDTETAWWAEVGEEFLRTIAFEQDGENEIAAVDVKACIFDRDPRVYPDTEPLRDVGILEDAILVRTEQAPLLPFVRFRPAAPQFSWTAWSATTAYAIGDLCYRDTTGHTYKAVAASTDKTPESQTAYWEPVEFPEFLRVYVRHGVRADELKADEGRYKEEARAAEELERLIDVKINQQVQRKVVFGRRR